ncbi:MAG TPA: TonB-dependent receptor plug domain-containing protein, partial [Xanthomonadales bacterium]|nr:TonB-dependent receptor plug domain-containing protein [Xanthomonadales bacterium]
MKPCNGIVQRQQWLAWNAALVYGLLFTIPCTADDSQNKDEPENQPLEEVVVTGTRIKRRDFTSPSPLTTIDRNTFDLSGRTTVEDFLNQLPQVQPDYGRTSTNDGTSNLNLRALGAGRTLVLLNGRRLAPSGVGSAVDVNNLPNDLIDRVELITGGASAVYGSDAIAGVVNFITRDDFKGFSLEASYNITEKGDSGIFEATAAYGQELAGGRGNLTYYAGYYDRQPLYASERELTSVSWLDTWTGELVQYGSPIIPAGVALRPRVDLGNGPVRMTWTPDGNPTPWDSSADFYNFAPLTYLQIPLTRYTVGLFGKVDLKDSHQAYFEAGFTRNEAQLNSAPAPFRGSINVNIDNPLLTPETRQVFADQLITEPGIAGLEFSRRMLELGPRITQQQRDYLRLVAGIRGEITNGWDYDAWITWTDASETELLRNDGSVSRFLQGLLVNPATGDCFDPAGGCVPLDVFGEGRLSSAGVDFLRVPPLENSADRSQTIASVVATGSPLTLSAGPLQTAFGAEWRNDEGTFKADPALFTGDTMGYVGTASVNGSESVTSCIPKFWCPCWTFPPTASISAWNWAHVTPTMKMPAR